MDTAPNIPEYERINQFSYSHTESDIEIIYDTANTNSQMNRYESLILGFSQKYDCAPQFISRAPGRVNLIGEHIDYEGFPVLPMALENDVLFAVAVIQENQADDGVIVLHANHVNPESLTSKTFEISKANNKNGIEFVKPHHWTNYLIAGFNAIYLNYLPSHASLQIKCLVTGNVPFASGLSSSSAVTVAAALAFAKSFGLHNKISKKELAEVTINYERSVGTACGGMDQTISIYAEKNQAKLIEFRPSLNVKTVMLPVNVSFVIANSMTDSPKISTLAYRYNKRVSENKMALAIIAHKLKLGKFYRTLSELMIALNVNYDQLVEVIEANLKPEVYSKDEVESVLEGEFTIDELLKYVPHYQDVLDKNTDFHLRDRLTHVCREAERVGKFYEICGSVNENTTSDQLIELSAQLGKLMNESHSSCKNLYECSSSELDSLVAFGIEKNAIGARLTGAGWGGCCVMMVPNEHLDGLLMALKEYYMTKNIVNGVQSDYFFMTKASQGACIFDIKN